MDDKEYMLSVLNSTLKRINPRSDRPYVYIQCNCEIVSELSKYLKINFKSEHGEFAVYTNPITKKSYDVYVIPYATYETPCISVNEISRENIPHITKWPISIFKARSRSHYIVDARTYSLLLNAKTNIILGYDWLNRKGFGLS